MKAIHKGIIFLTVFITSFNVNFYKKAIAQDDVVEGTVYKDGEPAPAATVTAHKTKDSYFTSFDGKYKVKIHRKSKYIKVALGEEEKKIELNGKNQIDVFFGEKKKIDREEKGVILKSFQELTNDDNFKRNYTYIDHYQLGNYDEAYSGWSVLFRIYPKSTANIYIHGSKILSHKIKNAENEKTKKAYIDTLMKLYDKRIKYFNQEGFVKGRKGVDMLRYRKENVKEAYKLLSKSVELQKNETEDAVLVTFMQTSVHLLKTGKLDGKDVINNYMTAIDIAKSKIANAETDNDLKRAQTAKANIEKLFANSGAAGCKDLVKIYTPKFEENPNDIEMLKNLTNILGENECTDAELYINASEKLYELEPSALAAYNLARFFFKNENHEKACEYYQEAISRQEDEAEKARYYFELAFSESELGKYSDSRSHALKAAKLKEDWGDPYILVATLYASSGGMCATDPNENVKAIQRKAVYWAAVDMLQKAISVDPSVKSKASSLISSYRAHYPNKQDAFFVGYKEGDTFQIGCWINTTTKVRF